LPTGEETDKRENVPEDAVFLANALGLVLLKGFNGRRSGRSNPVEIISGGKA